MEIRNSLSVIEGKKTMFEDEKITKQEFKKACDINEIVKSYARNGQDLMANPPQINMEVATDLTKIGSYAEMLNSVILAQDAFSELSPAIRRRFNEDPGKLIEFLKDPQNKEEGQKLGLIKPDPEPVPEKDSPKT